MNDFVRIVGGQDNRRNIFFFGVFLEFLVKIFILGYVDFSKRFNEAGRNMMVYIKFLFYFKDINGNEKMKFYMNNFVGERADLFKVIIEILFFIIIIMGIR